MRTGNVPTRIGPPSARAQELMNMAEGVAHLVGIGIEEVDEKLVARVTQAGYQIEAEALRLGRKMWGTGFKTRSADEVHADVTGGSLRVAELRTKR